MTLTAAAVMGAGDRNLKRKLQAGSAPETERHRHGKKKQARASSSLEGYEILKAKKDALAAIRLGRFQFVPGGMDVWMDHWPEMKAAAEAEAAGKRVVKKRLPKAFIDDMVATPFTTMEDLTPAQLAKRSCGFRKLYALAKFTDDKFRDYEQAIIRQYNTQGYAEDETEVADSDSEEEDATVVQNE